LTKNKTAIAITLLMMLTTSFVMLIPPIEAQAPTMKTYAILDATPNPVGVGEETLIRFGVIEATGDASYGWTGITVTIKRPDGGTDTIGPVTTDSTGGTARIYVPDKVGTYNLTVNFPQQTNPVDFFNMEANAMVFAGTVMLASSKTMQLVVQEAPLPSYPDQPLPSEYWSRTIDAQLRSWYTISGNWLSRPENAIALYNDYAPETAHVLWQRPITFGGLTGGLLGDHPQVPASHESGDAYEGKFSNSVIIDGILYYNRMPSPISGVAYPQHGIYAVNLRTGKEVWFRNNTVLSFGQTLYFNSFNTDGVFNYIWDTSGPTWNAYDPYTAEWVYSYINVPSGTQVFGPNGEILIYVIDYANKWMALWNSTACGQQDTGAWSAEGGSVGSWGRNVHGLTWNGSNPKSYSWNVTIPAGLESSTSFFVPILKVYPDRVMSMAFNLTQVRVWALSTAPATRGQKLFDETWPAPSEWQAGTNTLNYVGATDYVQGGVMALWDKELTTHYGFSTETGKYLWQTESEHWLDAYGWGNAEHTWYFAYDHLYSVGVAGIVYAYNLADGTTDWTYTMSDPYNEPVTGNNWWGWITMIADGKVYVGTLEHSAENPIPRGGPYICINATDGSEIWRINGMFRQTRWGGNAIMGDSIIATMDTYDQNIYAIGKGPSETRVSVSPDVLPLKNGVMITGYVTDISAGTKDDTIAARFPNGVPAVSDESQSGWMLYVYKQFARPINASGVEVTLSVLDANNNYREIGKTTTNTDGFFKFSWAPDIEGDYTLYASFTGSAAYYPSHALAAFNVGPAAQESTPVNIPPDNSATNIMYAAIGIIVAIFVAMAVAVLILRKR
jgi:PQQ-like domain